MPQTPVLERLKSGEILVADGATGTNLIERGLPPGVSSESWVLDKPEEIVRLHQDFIAAGARIILTCTFGANALRLAESRLAGQVFEVNHRAVQLAREAVAGRPVYIAGSIGPLGKLLKPYGPLSHEEATATYQEQIQTLVEAGVDLLVIETQFDLTEAGCAILAARSASQLPLVVSFSYDRGTKTMMGVTPSQMAKAIAEQEVDILGINCGRSLEDNLNALKELRQATTRPIWFKPNAGIPIVDEIGNSTYTLEPQALGERTRDWLTAGAVVVGGCCGTSPDHLNSVAKTINYR
jgi:5-methyltetrahydrofolate--homocysteine methyltransferase